MASPDIGRNEEVFDVTVEEPSLAIMDHLHSFVDADYEPEDDEE